MRILYVDLTNSVGGSLISLEQLVRGLDRRQFEPAVLLSARNPVASRFRQMRVPVVTVPTFSVEAARSTPLVSLVKGSPVGGRLRDRGLFARMWAWARSTRNVLTRTLPLTWRLYRAIRTQRPDLVHANDAVFVTRPAIAAAWLAGVPVVCHVRSLGPFGVWDRLWAGAVRQFIYITQWVADDQAHRGIPAGKGRLIYNGVDLRRYASELSQQAARARLGLPPDRPVVAVIGRLVPWKGQDLFLRAMRQVVEAAPGALGLVVGETESFSREFGAELEALQQALDLGDVVRFLGHSDDVPTVLAAADVLAHTSVTPEPFGRVMVEAMAAGRPVVTPAEGGGTEIVIDGVTGRWFRPRDAGSLAAAIIELLTQPTRARSMAAAGRARAFECFSNERLVAELSACYRELDPAQRGRT